jgi:hypothetical protein
MLSIHLSLAAVAVAALMLNPRSSVSAALDIAFGARVTPALAVVAPLVASLRTRLRPGHSPAVVAGAVLLTRNSARLQIPWRIAVQVAGLVILAQALGFHPPSPQRPARERLGRLATRRRPARLRRHNRTRRRCGALAAPQGSVATIIAADLAGPTTPPLTRRLAPLPTAALLAATLLLKARL